MQKALSDIKQKLKGLGYAGNDQDQINKLQEELKRLRNEFDHHAEIAMKQFGVIEQVLPTKADKSELIDLQNQILDKLRDMI